MNHPARRSQLAQTSPRRWLLAAGAALGLAAAALADPNPPEKGKAEMLAAQALARLVLLDLKAAQAPTPEDYKIADEMLASAAELARLGSANDEPDKHDDQTMLRLWLEAAAAANDTARVREIARRLLKLDGADTVSQLRVISANIAELQTADDRLAAYDRLLGDDGSAIDESVRSRLALDAALLVRERGDIDGFADRLAKSLQLDPTNKDAATLALNFYVQSQTDPVGRADLMMSVLYADPYDPEVYQSLVSLMLENGCYRGAARFGSLAQRLYNLLGVSPVGEGRTAIDLAEWDSAGAEAVIKRLSGMLERERDAAAQERKALELAGKPADGVPKPQDIRLPFGSDRVRLIAASSLGDKERASTFLMEIAETGRRHADQLLDPAKRPKDVHEDDVAPRLQHYLAEMVWLRVWSGLQLDEAANGLQMLRDGKLTDAATMTRLEAWLALRSGDRDVAEGAFKAKAATDPLSLLGLAVLAESKGDKPLAASRYADVAARLPSDLAGAYARTRYYALTGEMPDESDAARKLDEIALGVPQWLDAMIDDPRRGLTLEVVPLRQEIQAIERTPFRVTLRNNAPIPLALGPDKPIDSRLLFAPTVDVGAQKLPSNDLVEVASIDRRLRLLPGESIDIVVWPDLSALSFALELASVKQTRVRWRVIQGFELGDQKQYEPCPHCTAADTPTLVRRPPNRSEAVAEAMRYALQTGGAREIAETVQSMILRLGNPQVAQPLTSQEVDALIEVLARRFNSLQRGSKILLLCILPTVANLPASVRVDQVAAQDSDEQVIAVQLALRTLNPDDPIFKSPTIQENPRLAELARLVKDRVTAQRPCFAAMALRVPEMLAAAQTGNASAAPIDPAKNANILPVPPDPNPVPVVP